MFISNEPCHDVICVYTLVGKIVPLLKEVIPNLEMVHYWIDSPISPETVPYSKLLAAIKNILASRPQGVLRRLAMGKARVTPSEVWLNERLIKSLKMGSMSCKTQLLFLNGQNRIPVP